MSFGAGDAELDLRAPLVPQPAALGRASRRGRPRPPTNDPSSISLGPPGPPHGHQSARAGTVPANGNAGPSQGHPNAPAGTVPANGNPGPPHGHQSAHAGAIPANGNAGTPGAHPVPVVNPPPAGNQAYATRRQTWGLLYLVLIATLFAANFALWMALIWLIFGIELHHRQWQRYWGTGWAIWGVILAVAFFAVIGPVAWHSRPHAQQTRAQQSPAQQNTAQQTQPVPPCMCSKCHHFDWYGGC